MFEILTPTKVGIALDVDGALFNTNTECYRRACEVWENRYDDPYPYAYEKFHSFRHMVARAEDYFTFTQMMIDNGGELPADAKEQNKTYLQMPVFRELKDAFYQFRKTKMGDDLDGWCAENDIYVGISEMMDSLGDTGWKIFVVTSKNRPAVEALLSHHKIGANVGHIYDKDDGKRPAQFAKASAEQGVDIRNIIPYDDLPKQLQAARALGMHPIAAPQGYGIPEEIKAGNFAIAWPLEFVGKAEDVVIRKLSK